MTYFSLSFLVWHSGKNCLFITIHIWKFSSLMEQLGLWCICKIFALQMNTVANYQDQPIAGFLTTQYFISIFTAWSFWRNFTVFKLLKFPDSLELFLHPSEKTNGCIPWISLAHRSVEHFWSWDASSWPDPSKSIQKELKSPRFFVWGFSGYRLCLRDSFEFSTKYFTEI